LGEALPTPLGIAVSGRNANSRSVHEPIRKEWTPLQPPDTLTPHDHAHERELIDAAIAVNEAATLDDAFQALAEAGVALLGCDRLAVIFWDENGGVVRADTASRPRAAPRRSTPSGPNRSATARRPMREISSARSRGSRRSTSAPRASGSRSVSARCWRRSPTG
jgi:hypothetical protein